MNEELAEKIGFLADRVDNLVAALTIPMPADFHIKALKESLPEIAKELKQIVIQETGENPWEGWED